MRGRRDAERRGPPHRRLHAAHGRARDHSRAPPGDCRRLGAGALARPGPRRGRDAAGAAPPPALGCGPLRAFFRVALPLASRGILAGTVLAFARALGEFGATIMVAGNIPGRTQTLSLAIFQSTQAGRDERAMTLAAVTVVLAFATLWATEWIQGRWRRA